jgi:RNA-directed DNA polymerase
MEGKMKGTPTPETVLTKLDQIAKLAGQMPGESLRTLAHHIDVAFLREAFKRTRKDGATGVDDVTAAKYAEDLDENLQELLNRFKSGRYRAPAVKRAYVPKSKSEKRPIGIPTFEDKVLQRAVTMVLNEVYERDFFDFSYGFRPKRSAHGALQMMWKELMGIGGGYVIEVDIKGYFDNISHSHLREMLDRRVRDGVIRKTINKWLRAGVMESGQISYPEAGSPQGGVVSPLLSNVYLHEVMDKWFVEDVRPRLHGRAFMVRYADDIVCVCENREDADRLFGVLPKRFERFGLELHPEKTRLYDFRRPPSERKKGYSSFDFLGFTHYWGLSRKGRFIVKRKTAKDRLARSLRIIKSTCKDMRHEKIAVQHEVLSRKLRGHYSYFGITGNSEALGQFFEMVKRIWREWLNRRSSGNHMVWTRFNRILKARPLPGPIAVHSALSTSQRIHNSRNRMR